MKRSDLKELIKKSMLEVAPKGDSGAMTSQEEKMVADYEREQAEMDLTSGPTVVPGAAPMRETSIILDPEEVYNEYSPLFKQYREEGMDRISAIKKAYSELAQKHNTTPLIISQFLDSYWNDQYRNSTYANEDVLREADEIVAAYAEKKTLQEADLPQDTFSGLHQVIKNIAQVNKVGMEEAAMQAIEYIAEQFDVPVDFRDF